MSRVRRRDDSKQLGDLMLDIGAMTVEGGESRFKSFGHDVTCGFEIGVMDFPPLCDKDCGAIVAARLCLLRRWCGQVLDERQKRIAINMHYGRRRPALHEA